MLKPLLFRPLNIVSICHLCLYIACKRDEPLNEFHSLFCVGVATLVHHLEDYRKGHALVDDAESEDIDISAAELIVCPIHRHRVRSLYRYEF